MLLFFREVRMRDSSSRTFFRTPKIILEIIEILGIYKITRTRIYENGKKILEIIRTRTENKSLQGFLSSKSVTLFHSLFSFNTKMQKYFF